MLARSSNMDAAAGLSSLPAVVADIPELVDDKQYQAMLLTGIVVFESIVLGDYDSGLTYPTILHDLDVLRGGETIEFRYHLGERPGFRHRVLSSQEHWQADD